MTDDLTDGETDDVTDGAPRSRHRLRTVALIAAGVVVLVVIAFVVFRAVVQPDDPPAFYDPPDPLPAGPPGTLVREESVDALADGQRAWRVLYTSTGLDGEPIAVSGVVVAPDGPAPPGGWPVVAWAHGTTGIVPPCAPSLVDPQSGLDRVPQLDELVAAGTVIAVTDYPGLGTPGTHPYLVGESEARAVLDSVRAARDLLGDETSATTAVFGHSQGGHAAVWADQIAAEYAPELEIAGVAAMAPPTDLAALLTDDDAEPAGIVLTSLALVSWNVTYPDTRLDAVVDDLARPIVEDLAAQCIATTDQGLSVVPDVAGLEVGFLSTDPVTAPGWADRLRENAPSTVARDRPMLVAQGLTDTLVRPTVTEAFVREQCADGAVIQLEEYADVGHFEVRTAAAPLVRTWLLDRLAGEPAATACTTTTRQRGETGGG